MSKLRSQIPQNPLVREINADASQPPRRIVFLDHTAALGGGEISLLNLVKNLNPTRYIPVVVLFAEGPLADALREADIETHIFPLAASVAHTRKDALGIRSFGQLKQALTSTRFTLALSRKLRSLKLDLVHTNSLKADVLGGVAARLAGLPLVWHIRDRIADDYLPKPIVTTFRGLSKILPHYLVANSHATLETLRPSRRRLQSGHARVVHNGTVHDSHVRFVSPEVIHADIATAQPLDGAAIGLIGRISPWKGQHIFIEAAAKVIYRFPDCRFQIIGSALFGEAAYDAQIRAMPTKLGIADRVQFIPFQKNVREAIDQLDILVHASTTGEPFGQVVVEGMAAGKPIVATRGGGIPEIVLDHITGLLVPMDDSESMSLAICSLLENPAIARKMGEAGQRRVEDRFTIHRTSEAIQTLYDSIFAPISHPERVIALPAPYGG